jgi:hypothetical protein
MEQKKKISSSSSVPSKATGEAARVVLVQISRAGRAATSSNNTRDERNVATNGERFNGTDRPKRDGHTSIHDDDSTCSYGARK